MSFLDLLFPKNCLQCNQSGGYICSKCLGKVQFSETICPVCGRFSIRGTIHETCRFKNSVDGLVILWEYDGVVRRAILDLKYRFAKEVATELGRMSAIEVNKFRLPKDCVLVPIPLHSYRQNWRGFNQAEEVGQEISKNLNWQIAPDLLTRNTNTTPQVHLRKAERYKNISGKFAVSKTSINKKTPIVLFDDVWTTGATLKEAGKLLKEDGFKRVFAMAIAKRRS